MKKRISGLSFNVAVCCILLLGPSMLFGAEQVYFFDPDSGVHARNLKAAMKDFFRQEGLDVNFHPFFEFRAMMQQMTKKPSLFVLAPPVYAEQLPGLVPVLIPDRDGQYTYSKLLISPTTISEIAELQGKTVAATSKEYLLALVRQHHIPDEEIRFIPVKKDIDALLALQVSQQVDAVIVKASGLEQFRAVNADAANRLHTLATFEVGLPMLWGAPDAMDSPEIQAMLELFLSMHTTPKGLAALQLLKYDAWHRITDELLELLVHE